LLVVVGRLVRLCTVSAQTQKLSPEGQKCLECHGSTTPGIVSQWNSSAREGGSGLLLMS